MAFVTVLDMGFTAFWTGFRFFFAVEYWICLVYSTGRMASFVGHFRWDIATISLIFGPILATLYLF